MLQEQDIRRKTIEYIVSLLLLVLGIIISMQFRSIFRERSIKSDREIKFDTLLASLEATRAQRDELLQKIEEADNIIKEYEKKAGQSGGWNSVKQAQLERAKLEACLLDVKGPGIIITMNDAEIRKGEKVNINDTIIHNMDIIEIVNELRNAGAQAISINGERIVATSEIVCTGPTITVNGTRTATPFVISAIGNPDKLYSYLNRPNGLLINLHFRKIRVDIDVRKNDSIVIPKYKGKWMGDINEEQ